jgi:hypothetical protein
MAFKDVAKSGALGLGTALIADNPKLLQGMGLVGNLAYNKIEDREERKRREAVAAAAGAAPPCDCSIRLAASTSARSVAANWSAFMPDCSAAKARARASRLVCRTAGPSPGWGR